MSRRLVLPFAATIAFGLLAGGAQSCGSSSSSSSSSPAKPKGPFVVSDVSVAAVVTDAINNGDSSPGLAKPPVVRCAGRADCMIDYTVKLPAGIDDDLELVQPQAKIWKTLFSDRRFRTGRITVSGPLTSIGGKSSNGPIFELDCDRAASDQIDWDHVDGKGMRTLCVYQRFVK